MDRSVQSLKALAPRTLVVEDDPAIRRGVMDALRAAGHQPTEAARGDEGLEQALSGDFDLVLLDMVLPGNTGWEILRVLRGAPELPIIVLTACGAEDQRVDGLKLGADDYVVKPFSLRELLARVDAVLRRAPAKIAGLASVQFAGGTIDMGTRAVTLENGQPVELSEKEAEVLVFLAGRAGETVSREQLLAGVWGLSPQGLNTRTVDMHITRLREKLGDDASRPRVLKTVWGRGYQFQASHAGMSPKVAVIVAFRSAKVRRISRSQAPLGNALCEAPASRTFMSFARPTRAPASRSPCPRSCCRIANTEYPYFMNCTIVDWLPVFRLLEGVDIVSDLWRYSQCQRAVWNRSAT